ncbi:MAG: HYR domain-containing protein, partial [Salinivirgaceae bacterium]|nr:HYR domain-containing protein [Salinivirgaceae bacterium]
ADINAECEVASLTAPTATDNCSGELTGTHSVALPITASTTVTWTYEDGTGNTSTQTQEVIIADQTAPVADLAELDDISAECEVTSLTAPTATDNCSGELTGTHGVALPITTSTTITWTYEDGAGNTSTQMQEVIIADQTAPVADLAELGDITAECEVTSLTAPTATDNCVGTITATHDATLPINTQTIITWTYNDGNGNTSEQTQNVVISDVSNPVPDNATLADINAECEVASLTAPTATDNCSGTVTGTTTDPIEYTEQGTYVVSWNFDDGNGNSINVNQNVIINDDTDPTISCIDNQTKQLSEDETIYAVSGTELDPTESSDNCNDFSVTNDFNDLSTLDGAEFPIGLTTVVWTITDGANNETQCSFDIEVKAFVPINMMEQNGISIYPNPTNGIINFEFANNNTQQLKISDLKGKTIIEKNNVQKTEIIDLYNFVNGIYIIKIQTDNEIFITKIVKE